MAAGPRLEPLLGRAVAGFRDPRTWRAGAYVVATFFSTLMLFVTAVLLLTPALVLSLIGVGIAASVGVFAILDRLVGFERRRAAWVGVTIVRRPFADGPLLARFRDPNRWRIAGFGFWAWVVALCALLVVVVAFALPLYLLSIPVWGWAIDSFSVAEILGQALVGAGLLLFAPAITRTTGRLLARFVEISVGPDRLVVMEQRLADVTESRDEILLAVAGERRRIERNLHDGVQQQLVALGIDLGLAEAKLDSDPEAARGLLADATRKTRESIGELRTISRGLHPAILGDRGLDAALSAVTANASLPVELRCRLGSQPPAAIAEAAYFIVSEALTNVMKHSRARVAAVDVIGQADRLTVSVYDDGRGGAEIGPAGSGGSGLAGIAARVRGLNGTIELSSPPGGPTQLTAVLPIT